MVYLVTKEKSLLKHSNIQCTSSCCNSRLKTISVWKSWIKKLHYQSIKKFCSQISKRCTVSHRWNAENLLSTSNWYYEKWFRTLVKFITSPTEAWAKILKTSMDTCRISVKEGTRRHNGSKPGPRTFISAANYDTWWRMTKYIK